MFLSIVHCFDPIVREEDHIVLHTMGEIAARTAIQALHVSHGDVFLDTEIQFQKDSQGKPHVVISHIERKDITVSISHSFPYAVGVAHAGGERVGCDVERVREFAPTTLAAFLTQKEKAILNAYSPLVKKVKTTLAWSFKEAILKAIGTGLRTHPSRVDVSELLKKKKQNVLVVNISHKTLIFQVWYKVLAGGYVVVAVAEIR